MSDSDDSDDEFFEAQEDFSNSPEKLVIDNQMNIEHADENQSADENYTADGVLQETEMNLLQTGEKLCIPVTQVIYYVTTKP